MFCTATATSLCHRFETDSDGVDHPSKLLN